MLAEPREEFIVMWESVLTPAAQESVSLDNDGDENQAALSEPSYTASQVSLRLEPPTSGALARISQALYAAFPTRKDAEILCKSRVYATPQLNQRFLILPYTTARPEDTKIDPEMLLDMPTPRQAPGHTGLDICSSLPPISSMRTGTTTTILNTYH